jgi:ABC-type sugar transport system substrate-binding protein
VMFSQTHATPFTAGVEAGVKEEAKRLNFTVKIIETQNLDQTAQDGLVRQFVASGAKPAAFLFWPSNAAASAGSVRLLSKVAPVIQIDNSVHSSEKPYVVAYAGGNAEKIGGDVGKLVTELRTSLLASGVKLRGGDKGNLLDLNFPAGYQPGIDRAAGLKEELAAAPFNVLGEEPGNFYATQLAYEDALRVLPKYKDDVDFVIVPTTSAGAGVAKALVQLGRTPGKDVWILAGNCDANPEPILTGDVAGASILAPEAEGRLSVDVAARYLATMKVTEGDQQYDVTATPPAVEVEAPRFNNYIPLAPISDPSDLKTIDVWGYGTSICS